MFGLTKLSFCCTYSIEAQRACTHTASRVIQATGALPSSGSQRQSSSALISMTKTAGTVARLKFVPEANEHTATLTKPSTETEVRRYLVEEVESFDIRLFSVEKLFGDVQELLGL